MKTQITKFDQLKISFNLFDRLDELDEEKDVWEVIEGIEWPQGWSTNEIYFTPIYCAVILEVEHLPTQTEIDTIYRLINNN